MNFLAWGFSFVFWFLAHLIFKSTGFGLLDFWTRSNIFRLMKWEW